MNIRLAVEEEEKDDDWKKKYENVWTETLLPNSHEGNK